MSALPLRSEGDPPLRLLVAYQMQFPGDEPEMLFCAPGRDLWLAGRMNGTPRFTLTALDINPDAPVSFTMQSARQMQTHTQRPLPRWARFPAAGLRLLASFHPMGMDALICGDEPPGPRYDYALLLLFAGLTYTLSGTPYTPALLGEIADAALREYL
jgi:hypothetical protein